MENKANFREDCGEQRRSVEQLIDLEKENTELNHTSDYRIDDNCVYSKNGSLIAKIVYQCVNCAQICYTINESTKHYSECRAINVADDCHPKTHRNNGVTMNKSNLAKKCETNVANNNTLAEIKPGNRLTIQLEPTNQIYLILGNKCETTSGNNNNSSDNNSVKLNRKRSRKRRLNRVESESVKANDNQYKCSVCGRMYATSKSLGEHKRIHSDPIVCDYPDCNKMFNYPSQLKVHYRIHTNDRFICDYAGCAFSTVHRAGFIIHQRAHSGERHKCPIKDCNHESVSLSSHRYHVLSHDNEAKTRFKCEWPGCDKSFRLRHIYIIHYRRHTNERPFQCDWPDCGKSFTSVAVRKIHRLTHTGEKRHCCDWPGCEGKFSTNGILNTHKKLVHKCDYIKRTHFDNNNKVSKKSIK